MLMALWTLTGILVFSEEMEALVRLGIIAHTAQRGRFLAPQVHSILFSEE